MKEDEIRDKILVIVRENVTDYYDAVNDDLYTDILSLIKDELRKELEDVNEEISKRHSLVSTPDMDNDIINRAIRTQYFTIYNYITNKLNALK